MFYPIIHPTTNKSINLYSAKGKQLLKKYIIEYNNQSAGNTSPKNNTENSSITVSDRNLNTDTKYHKSYFEIIEQFNSSELPKLSLIKLDNVDEKNKKESSILQKYVVQLIKSKLEPKSEENMNKMYNIVLVNKKYLLLMEGKIKEYIIQYLKNLKQYVEKTKKNDKNTEKVKEHLIKIIDEIISGIKKNKDSTSLSSISKTSNTM